MTGQRRQFSVVDSDARWRINIIGKACSRGLACDIDMLRNALVQGGHEVHVMPIDSVQSHRRRSWASQARAGWRRWSRQRSGSALPAYDVNLMLEHVWPQFLADARCNVVIPNPEWFDRHDLRCLRGVDAVWAKTPETLRIFQGLGCRVRHIGFTSEDRYQPEVRRQRRFLHLAGKSPMKGSDALVRLWAAHPQWPTLTLIQRHHDQGAAQVQAANIQRLCGYQDEETVRREQNACRFHLCPSRTEGWGHYIVEGLGVGAVVFTVDAPPMNQLVQPDCGILVSYAGTGKQRLATTYDFCSEAMGEAVERVLASEASYCQSLSARARAWYQYNQAGFSARILTALAEDCRLVR